MKEQRTKVVQDFFKAFAAGNMDAAYRLLSPEINWTYHGPVDRIPFAGTFRGHDGVKSFFQRVNESLSSNDMSIDSLVCVDDLVIGRGTEQSTSRNTGRVYKVAWVHLYRIKGRQMTSFEEFIDTAAVADTLA